MSMMDPDVEFFGVQIKKGEDVGMQDYLESEEASYSSLHITQVRHTAPGASYCTCSVAAHPVHIKCMLVVAA